MSVYIKEQLKHSIIRRLFAWVVFLSANETLLSGKLFSVFFPRKELCRNFWNKYNSTEWSENFEKGFGFFVCRNQPGKNVDNHWLNDFRPSSESGSTHAIKLAIIHCLISS